MRLVVSGLLNKQIGGELGINEATVKAHRGQVMRKMKADSLPDLVTMSHAPRATASVEALTAGPYVIPSPRAAGHGESACLNAPTSYTRSAGCGPRFSRDSSR